jgi:hypothetical protein
MDIPNPAGVEVGRDLLAIEGVCPFVMPCSLPSDSSRAILFNPSLPTVCA